MRESQQTSQSSAAAETDMLRAQVKSLQDASFKLQKEKVQLEDRLAVAQQAWREAATKAVKAELDAGASIPCRDT